jgi:hypothetical protein
MFVFYYEKLKMFKKIKLSGARRARGAAPGPRIEQRPRGLHRPGRELLPATTRETGPEGGAAGASQGA